MAPSYRIIFLFLLTLTLSCTDHKEETLTIIYSGGGVGGGINPTFTEYIIHHDGKIVINTKYLYTDDATQVKQTTKSSVDTLYQYMIDQGFLRFDDVYDCAYNDSLCQDLKTTYPPAVPLKITLDDKGLTHSVTVSVFHVTDLPVVEYPVALDSIVAKINEVIAGSSE